MKLKYHVLTVFYLTLMFSCSSPNDNREGAEEEIVDEEIIEEETETEEDIDDNDNVFDGDILTITNGMSFAEINEVLKTAVSGDIVEIESGTYIITGELAIKSGIALRKKSSTPPVFTAWDISTSEMLEQYWSSDNSNIDIYGIQFNNIRLNIRNATNTSIRECIFDEGRRKAGTTKTFTQDAYVQLYKCNDILVENTVFKRREGDSGRGIYTVDCVNTEILNNTFGDGAAEGYFVTAINDNSDGTIIRGNTIQRNTSWEDLDETDHGIYVHSFKGIIIENNTISGWPTNSSGGTIKIRNGEDAIIKNNDLITSGIIMYVYENTPNHPYLKNIQILNNTISVSNSEDDIYHGIGYWRNTIASGFYEESITISGNGLPNGTIKISSPIDAELFNKSGGGVYNNNVGVMYLDSGINNSGNY